MNASSRVRVGAVLLSLVVVASAQPARGHGVLLDSAPKGGETVELVKRLELRFNNRIEPSDLALLRWPPRRPAPLSLA
jgi:methionine-rich copper-binding protein CopC